MATTITRDELRRENLRRAVTDLGGVTKVSQKLGYTNASYLSAMIGPNPSRPVSEKTARKFEAQMGLPNGSLDTEFPATTPSATLPRAAPLPGMVDVAMMSSVLKLVAHVLDEEGLHLPYQKFADLSETPQTTAASRARR